MKEEATRQNREEIMILDHEPKPGYRAALVAAAIVGLLWLMVCFAGVFQHGA